MLIVLDTFFRRHPDKIFDEKYLKNYLKTLKIEPTFVNVFHCFLIMDEAGTFWGNTQKRVLEQMKNKKISCKNKKFFIRKRFFCIVD